MARLFVIGLVIAGLSLFAKGQTSTVVKGIDKDIAEVRQVEDAITSALDHNDANALDRLWGDDYVFVNPGGVILTKAQRLAVIRSGEQKLESYTRDEETIRIYGDTAVVIYRSTVKGEIKGQDVANRRRVTNVLVKRNGKWQVVSHQTTIIYVPPTAPAPKP
jgi:ketosteroid isomerase-like protein